MLPKQLQQNVQSISAIASNLGIQNDSLSVIEDNSRKDIQYTIKINAPNTHPLNQSNFNPQPSKRQSFTDFQSKQLTTKIPYVAQSTGYDNNRQLYSEDQIREAFKIIDINKDGALTTDDLSFFLDCMAQEHTLEEVKQMIRIVSNDGQKVLLDDFKKIGKGKIIPFAGIKMPDQNTKSKATVLQNLKQSNLWSLTPSQLSQQQQALQINYDKFQAQKDIKIQKQQQYLQEDIQEDQLLSQTRSSQQIKIKKKEFSETVMLNIQKVIQNYKNSHHEYVETKHIAQMLSISEKKARQLFPESNKKITAKSVLMDTILFCRKVPTQRLELILLHMNKNQKVYFDEWLQVLVFMMGSDKRKAISRKLMQILRNKKLDVTFAYDKYLVLQIMDQSLKQSHFIW